jgi:hypothetical protein
MIYELREYKAFPDTVDRLHRRFEDHVLPLFVEHQIEVLGFWVDSQDSTRLLYLTAFPNEEERVRRWDAFKNDPEWKSVKQASEVSGPLTSEIVSRILQTAPYWSSTTGVMS